MDHPIQIDYAALHRWESYAEGAMVEYRQCLDEGLDAAPYEQLFRSIQALPPSAVKARMGDALFELVQSLPRIAGYPYTEPSDLPGILALRPAQTFTPRRADERLPDRILGAWQGRVIGCMLGKTVEGITTDELHPLLQSSGNWPMHRYIRSTDVTPEMIRSYSFDLQDHPYIDQVTCAPADDDTNYTVFSHLLVEECGRDFTPSDVMRMWVSSQPKNAYCTAERVAFCNSVMGYAPPATALWHNPYREWIGAQIRGDYFGYINPGDPASAADMAWRDASISHVKNGIYGEMFVSAMTAAAAVESDLEAIILAGLDQIPATSRLYEAVMQILTAWREGVPAQTCIDRIHQQWDEHTSHAWCHTISNAMIVTVSLLYGCGDFSRSICMAVQAGFDTDCNGATVGSILGIRGGMAVIDPVWLEPFSDQLDTSIFGVGRVSISGMAEKTLRHIPR